MACAGGGAMALLLQSCGISKTLTGSISDSDLLVSLSDFETKAGNETHYKKYIIVSNDKCIIAYANTASDGLLTA